MQKLKLWVSFKQYKSNLHYFFLVFCCNMFVFIPLLYHKTKTFCFNKLLKHYDFVIAGRESQTTWQHIKTNLVYLHFWNPSILVCLLEKAIVDLMAYFRTTFEEESVTPKLHLLEEHVIEFIQRWRIGLGLYGEQGAESIHPEFNELRKIHSGIVSDEERIKAIFEQHHMKVRPEARVLIPEKKPRKLKRNEE